MNKSVCRFCQSALRHTFIDLGFSPLSNAFVSEGNLSKMEPFYPLLAYVCEMCFLVQLEEFESPEQIFSDYAYFSSFSKSWLEHCHAYVDQVSSRFNLGANHLVVEIASNDGYLLKFFQGKGIPVLGIEPAANVAEAAVKAGVPTRVEFFGTALADRLKREQVAGDLIVGNNVLAHVPDLNDFVEGMKRLLKPSGVITMEFPHLLRLMKDNQFDTIYHEHFSYFSFHTVQKVFAAHALRIFDVQEIPTHGGSLRIFACHQKALGREVNPRVQALNEKERQAGLTDLKQYFSFAEQAANIKRDLLEFLIRSKRERKRIVGYGAPAKGNTLLNYCGIRTDFIDFTVDMNPHKQGLFLPGTHIPILSPDRLRREKPDYVLILPWNIRAEIVEQLRYIRDWGAKFVVAVPRLEVF